MRIRARHYATGELIELSLHGGFIDAVSPASGVSADHEAEWVAPALFDLQINGALGLGFTSPTLTSDDVRRIAAVCRAHGIAAFCPTLITSAHETFCHAFKTLAQ